MDSQEALKFINSLFDEKTKPILNELEASIFLGFWEDRTYKEITAKAFRSEQYMREAGAKLCKRIKEDLGISVNKKNFKNPIEYRRQQYSVKVPPSQELLPQQSNSGEQKASVQASPQVSPNLLQHQNSVANPFVPLTEAVDNPQLFFDREREIRRIFEVLNSGSSVALIGEEGIGKSSVLWEICRRAESCLQSRRQPVFLDLNWVRDEDDFYRALCNEIGIPQSDGYMLTRNLQTQRVMLAIDNIGKLTWKGFTRQVRDHLRGLASKSDAPLKLILSASEPLERLFNDSQEGGTSPLAGICQEENLKPWDETTARAFIDTRLAVTSVRFTEEEIIQLVQESGGHPRRLMQSCYQTYSRYVEGGE